jgi:hypothetical protein
MEPEIRIIRPGEANDFDKSSTLRWVEQLSRWLDSRFTIPGTRIRFGLDPIFSLFPVIGDLITYMISGMLIYTMYQQGASRKVVIKMVMNSTVDAVLGSIPLIGTVFDIFYRSNDRNVRLLREHYLEGKHQGSGNGMLLVIVVGAIVVVSAAFYGMWKLMQLIF